MGIATLTILAGIAIMVGVTILVVGRRRGARGGTAATDPDYLNGGLSAGQTE